MTPEERRRTRHERYNQSEKGQARNRRYEEAHPERKRSRWERQHKGRGRD